MITSWRTAPFVRDPWSTGRSVTVRGPIASRRRSGRAGSGCRRGCRIRPPAGASTAASRSPTSRASSSPAPARAASLPAQNLDEKMHWPPRTQSVAVEQALLDALPHLRWVDLDSHGYVVIDVTRERVTAEWWFVDTVVQRAPGQRLGAAWTVERGR